jgi:hypothetical protein
MNKLSKIPDWAFELATPNHRHRAINAHQNGTLQIIWPDSKPIKLWAKQQGWRVPWFNFNQYFISKMLESDVNFALVLQKSGLKVSIPLAYYKISDNMLHEWDALYEEREDMGVLGLRPVGWGHLVECLREVRRTIEVGLVIEIEDEKLESVGEFLTWVDKRYHALEDGYDSWVGDDNS